MNTIIIPVHITASDTHTLTVRPQDNMQDCPACARGEGCGARPWFRGLLTCRSTLNIPRRNHTLQNGEHAELHLPAHILNRLTALAYGIPLLAFIAALALSQPLPETLQLPLALLLGATGHIAAQRYGERLLHRHLTLHPGKTGAPQPYPPRQTERQTRYS